MEAIIKLDVPEWQIGTQVSVYFKDTMFKKGVCEALTYVIPFEKLCDYEVVWLEVRNISEITPWVKTKTGKWFSPLHCSESIKEMHVVKKEEYNITARCWSARPSEEQRIKEEWV